MKKMSKKSVILLIIAALALIFGITLLIVQLKKSSNKEEWDNDRKEEVHARKVVNELDEIAKNLNVEIHRYDADIFAIDPKNPAEGVRALESKYPEFLVERGAWQNPQRLMQISGYLQDPYIKEIKAAVDKEFGDMSDLQAELKGGLTYYKYYFPDARVPQFYTLVEGIDASPSSPRFCFSIEDSIIILPDWYLGRDFKYYKDFRIDNYVRERCDKRYAAIDCFREILAKRHLPSKTAITLLDVMIAEGKTLYFTESMFPDVPAADIIGYSSEQFAWAKANQANVWNYMIENEMVFSKNETTARHLVGVAPETKPFKGSPGRMGAFIGWMIVINYMESHPETSISDLMAMPDSREILDKSGYKPLK